MKRSIYWIFISILSVVSLSAVSWVSIKKSTDSFSNFKSDTISAAATPKLSLFDNYVAELYQQANLSSTNLDESVLKKALIGYHNFKKSNLLSADRAIITIVDFNKSSRENRLWIIDLDKKQLLFNTLVAHGQGSGDDLAQNFSNTENSHQSSLGFYITNNIYQGKHGKSLILNGMDRGFNTNAKARSVVVHGAEYVSQDFIKVHGRLGRSHGCPALPPELTSQIIETIKDRTCLFINGPQPTYTSSYLDQSSAESDLLTSSNTRQATL
ncbi:MAG: hypothetical protein JWQ25_589 [Daejeonella sp.]|nr:hypothetical protein [Daejeonella sp.]